ncbi:Crp/Fnr family transcriptional regulator [Chryseobacterium paridis]|uniref:Crp/Fnr family transcriptional regulator n=1 Tax=Chryseobacterium paridis TaxID=2800328 RepID=A0ABS1FYB8_9FLAO|nr:Crp/Fnr family transcriptional regulator [Chryseobacterium paridis]MBK1897213.1 Crp/Fnr family transcriptional regulator [Chryseobacterium paridis]
METDIHILQNCLPDFGKELLIEIEKFSTVKTFAVDDFIVKQGQLARYLPIVLEGHVKAYSNEDGLQFLLYYITPKESCIFSFVHLFSQQPIDFSAVPEEETKILLIPIEKAKEWTLKYPSFNNMIINGFQKHYNDLLETTKQIICYKLEDRLWNYLKTKNENTGSGELSITHKNIADDLGTSREVISRVMRKLELDNKIFQEGRKIKIR